MTTISPRKKRLVAHFTDGTRVCDLVWFNSVNYVRENLHPRKKYVVFGKPRVFNGRIQFSHPDIDDADKIQLNDMGMQPYYTTTEKMKKAGLTSRSIERLTKTLLAKMSTPLSETLPPLHHRAPAPHQPRRRRPSHPLPQDHRRRAPCRDASEV